MQHVDAAGDQQSRARSPCAVRALHHHSRNPSPSPCCGDTRAQPRRRDRNRAGNSDPFFLPPFSPTSAGLGERVRLADLSAPQIPLPDLACAAGPGK